MGRPKKKFSELKLIGVNVRVTAEEFQIVSENAESVGLSIAEYARRKSTKKALPKTRIHPSQRKLFVALSRIGNNLNQLSKVYCPGMEDPLGTGRELEEIQQLLAFLKSEILKQGR